MALPPARAQQYASDVGFDVFLDDRTLEDNSSDEEDESYSSEGSDSAGEMEPAVQVCCLAVLVQSYVSQLSY